MTSILCLDIGSSSIRGIVYDEKGRSLFTSQRQYCPTVQSNSIVEQDSDTWISLIDAILKTAGAFCRDRNIDITAISVTSQRSSLIPLDKSGKSLSNTMMWHDRRTIDLCEELSDYNSEVYRICGLPISPVFSAVKMLWIKKNMSEIYDGAYKLVGIHDYILNYLTGRFVTDESFASRTNLFDLKERQWSDKLLTIFQIQKQKLCEVIPPGTVCGRLKKELAKRYGFKNDVEVVTAGGDQQCSAIGMGVHSKGHMGVTTGTGAYIVAHSDEPVIDKQHRILCSISAIPGKYIVEASTLTSGVIYNWFNKLFFDENDYDEINNAVSMSPVGANGLLLLPHFKGAGAPRWNPNAKGVLYNLSLETSKGDMARAILEGIAMETADSFEIIQQLCGEQTSISISGGLTKFGVFNQILADVLDKEVGKTATPETTSTGAWISAAVAVGLYGNYSEAYDTVMDLEGLESFSPIDKHSAMYRDIVIKRNEIYDALLENNVY